MAKVLMIGIDSLDSILLSKFEEDLPNFRKLKRESPNIRLESVCPPDSPTAWSSIYTGLNPARHGAVYFMDPIDKVSLTACEDIDNSYLRGNTFWDIAGSFGKRVCIMFPLLGYPVWAVNGIMLGRSNQRGKVIPIQTFPESLSEQYEPSRLNQPTELPTSRSYKQYIETWRKLAWNEMELGLKMLASQEWDLFFTYSSAIDDFSHNFWMYCDENDPSYPGDNPYKGVIKDLYILYDEIIGQFMAEIDSETTIIVLSDHGHGLRPPKLININEILRDKGYLVSKIKNLSYRDPYYLMERLKRKIANSINKYTRYGIGELAMRVMHTFSRLRKIYTSPLSIDWHKTVAYVSDLSGIKAYSYGGIVIRKENLKNQDYEEVRSLLIKELSEIREPDGGDNLVRWICRREKLYSGEYIDKYPDIVFELRDDYGAGWDIHSSIFSTCYTHNIQPGSHKMHSAVLLMSNVKSRELVKEDVTLMDIAPTVLSLLGIEDDFGFNGTSIFTPRQRKEF